MSEKTWRKFPRYRTFFNKVRRASVIGLKMPAYKRVKAMLLVSVACPYTILRVPELWATKVVMKRF